MSIVSAIKNHFLKSRIIGLSCNLSALNIHLTFKLDHTNSVMTQLSKGDLENPDEYFLVHDAMKFYVLYFSV